MNTRHTSPHATPGGPRRRKRDRAPAGQAAPAEALRAVSDITIQTRSGRVWNLLDPDPAHVDFADIAEALARIPRFAGQTNTFYSVAQHSLLVADHVDDIARPHALLRDAHRAILDPWDPKVRLALSLIGGEPTVALDTLVHRTSAAIFRAARVPVLGEDSVTMREIRTMEASAKATVWRDLTALRLPRHLGNPVVPPFPRPIRALAWPAAQERYHEALADAGIITELRRG